MRMNEFDFDVLNVGDVVLVEMWLVRDGVDGVYGVEFKLNCIALVCRAPR